MSALQDRIIIQSDYQTGTKKFLYTALCPAFGITDDGRRSVLVGH